MCLSSSLLQSASRLTIRLFRLWVTRHLIPTPTIICSCITWRMQPLVGRFRLCRSAVTPVDQVIITHIPTRTRTNASDRLVSGRPLLLCFLTGAGLLTSCLGVGVDLLPWFRAVFYWCCRPCELKQDWGEEQDSVKVCQSNAFEVR